LSITAITSTSRIVARRCAMMIVVRPSMIFSSAACTTASLRVSSALVASSSRMMRGSRTNARAIAMRCFWPPDSCAPLAPITVS
jgi:predicted transcriptional regulator